jgi:uncharacterized repeat protein (TIGR03803 family)
MKQIVTQVTALMAALVLSALNAKAQTFTNLHSFGKAALSTSTYLYTNSDGAYLYTPLVLSGNSLYGVASGDNINGLGGLFRINTDGTGFSNIFSFSLTPKSDGGGDDGGDPMGLMISGNSLYGTTRDGGTSYTGSIFANNTNGTGLVNLHFFSALGTNIATNADGAYPEAGLVLSGDRLYGTTSAGGTYGDGTIFAIDITGGGFTNLFNFARTNGQLPEATLVVSGNTLYGTTYSGGSGNDTNGTIFAINTDGTGFTNFHSFSPLGYPYQTNIDGAYPQGGLTLSGGVLYGTTGLGGNYEAGYGTIFAISTNGTGFTNILYLDFTKGSTPYSQLLLTNNTLYGTATSGGANYSGTVFSVNTDGTGLTDLYDFPLAEYSGSAYTNSSGAEPWAGLVMSDNTLFGVTPAGGAGGVGTVFAVILPSSAPVPIPLDVQVTGGTVVLSWIGPEFSLQSASSLGSAFTNVPGATSPYIVSPTSAQSQQFFRLQAN